MNQEDGSGNVRLERQVRPLDQVDELGPLERYELLGYLQSNLLGLWRACDSVEALPEETLGAWHRRIMLALKALNERAEVEINGFGAA